MRDQELKARVQRVKAANKSTPIKPARCGFKRIYKTKKCPTLQERAKMSYLECFNN